jgi:hypothetical protein
MKWLLILSTTALFLACGTRKGPIVRPTEGDVARCKQTVEGIKTRIEALEAERGEVERNTERLPAGYDQSSIDGTLAQIQKEIDVRQQSLPRMLARCAEMESGL